MDAAAAAAGLRPGLPLADARAMVPRLVVADADPAGDRAALERLADWCDRYTPWVAVDGDGGLGSPGAAGLWLDISGCAHLWDGEAALLTDLLDRLDAASLQARAAVADTPGAAWAAARFAGKPESPALLVPVGETAQALAPLPIAGLRLEATVVAGLARMGLRRIGDLIPLPRAPLAARFGAVVLGRLDMALGRVEEPVSPRRPAPPLRLRLAFPEPIGRIEDVRAALDRLLRDLHQRLEREDAGVRRAAFVLYRVDGTTARLVVGTSRPTRDPAHLARLFAEDLDGLDTGFGVETAILAALTLAPLPPAQAGLTTGDRARPEEMAQLVDRLGSRLGTKRVQRLVLHASHLPERACRAVSALAAPPPPNHGEAGRGPMQPRPLRLLPWPEPIEAVAPVPDHPPVMIRWRRRHHRVARAEGPERIAPEWWLEDDPPAAQDPGRLRDYYRVEDTEGRRFWVFRQGLYRPDRPPRWYLHGVFA